MLSERKRLYIHVGNRFEDQLKKKLNKCNMGKSYGHPLQRQPDQKTRIAFQSMTTLPAELDSVYAD
jgi:hypothetical protein